MDFREEIEGAAAAFRTEPIPALTFSLYRLFDEEGDRLRFETAYFERRRRLVAFGLAAALDRKPEDLAALHDAIWAVCDEFSWALPAHLGGRSLEPAALADHATCLDLFACETAFALAEIRYVFRADLAPIVAERIAAEVRRRVLAPFVARRESWSWELMRNNWCAVCAGSIGTSALYLSGEGPEREAILDRVLPTLDRFLESFSEDGACLEGLSYWTYGVGFFTTFADLLLERTGGKIDLLAAPRFRRVAAFQGTAYLNDALAVSFADGDSHERWRPGLTAYLSRRFPEAAMPPRKLAAALADDRCGRWALSYRDLIWSGDAGAGAAASAASGFGAASAASAASAARAGVSSAASVTGAAPLAAREPVWFPDAEWLICPARTETSFAFAAKGGHNDEPHNHNDVGSFILACGDDELVADLGAGEYVKDYFNENRYSIFCCSSESHSVPLVNGAPQLPGAERRARDVAYRRGDGVSVLSMDIAPAYGEATLRLRRRFEFADTGELTVVDEIGAEGEAPAIVERFVTRCGVELTEEGAVIRGKTAAALVIAAGTARPRVREHAHREHDGRVTTVRSLDFVAAPMESETGRATATERPAATARPAAGVVRTFRFEFRPFRRS